MPDRLWRASIELLMLVDESGRLPPIDDITWWTRKEEGQIKSLLCELADIGFISFDDSGTAIYTEYLAREAELKEPREPLPTGIREKVMARDNYTCRYCGEPAEHIDHVLPLSRGGGNEISNLVASCVSCNLYKRARTPEEAGLKLR